MAQFKNKNKFKKLGLQMFYKEEFNTFIRNVIVGGKYWI